MSFASTHQRETEMPSGSTVHRVALYDSSRQQLPAPAADVRAQLNSGSRRSRARLSDSTASSSSSVEDDFDVLPEHSLGSGSFATVVLAVDKASGDQVALKRISVAGFHDELLAQQELELTRRVSKADPSCPCVKAIAGYSDRDDSSDSKASRFNIVYDLMRGGSLEELDLSQKPLSERDVKTVMRRVLSGIKTVHKAKVAHFDILLANLLLETPGDFGSARICDFGLAQDLKKSKTFKVIAGTPQYFAPELVRTHYTQGSSFGKEVDVWAAGVVMYELLCGAKPFPSLKPDVLFREIFRVELRFAEPAWETVSPEARQLVTQLLTFSPSKRPSAKQALRHSWFAGPANSNNNSPCRKAGAASWLACLKPQSVTC